MKKYLFLLTLASLFGVISCNSDKNAVSDEEWKEAIENIVNYKKNNKLNYVADGDVARSMTREGETDT